MFKRFWTIFSLGAPDWLRQYVGMNELNLLNADKLPAFYIFNRTVLICPRSWMCWISLSIESRWGREIPLTEITKSWSLIAVAYMLVMKWIVLSNITWKFSFLACVILWSLTAELKLGEGDERRGGLGQFLLGMCRWPFRTPSPLYCLFCRPQRPNFGAHICHFLFMHINPYKAKFSSANRLLNSLLSQHSLFLKIPNCATNSIQSNPLYGYTLIADTSLLWSRVFSVFPVENPYYILYKSSPLNTDTPINADNGHSFISLAPTFLL